MITRGGAGAVHDRVDSHLLGVSAAVKSGDETLARTLKGNEPARRYLEPARLDNPIKRHADLRCDAVSMDLPVALCMPEKSFALSSAETVPETGQFVAHAGHDRSPVVVGDACLLCSDANCAEELSGAPRGRVEVGTDGGVAPIHLALRQYNMTGSDEDLPPMASCAEAENHVDSGEAASEQENPIVTIDCLESIATPRVDDQLRIAQRLIKARPRRNRGWWADRENHMISTKV